MTLNGATLTRAIRYPPMAESPGGGHVWAGSHGDINLITALPRASAAEGARAAAPHTYPARVRTILGDLGVAGGVPVRTGARS